MGVPMTQAGIQAPVLAFPSDDDVFPFENVDHLFGKSGWWVGQDRHVGVEIVDSAEQRWVISGLVQAEPAKRRWWQFGKTSSPEWEIEIEPLDPQPFAATRQRVELQASQIFDAGDEALADIRAAGTMAELSQACFEITLRAQGCRILAGDVAVPVRTTIDVAERALVLCALVGIGFKADRIRTMEWLSEHDLIKAISAHEPPLFTSLRLSEQQRAEAVWNVENLSALIWALGFADMPASDDHPDLSAINEIVPPAADIGVDQFKASSPLRPSQELAQMADIYRTYLREAKRSDDEAPSDDGGNLVEAIHRRYFAIQWILNPERLEWF